MKKSLLSLALAVCLPMATYTQPEIKWGFNSKPPIKRGFVLGFEYGFHQYDDKYTKNLRASNWVFGYNTSAGICPEIRLGKFREWKGKDIHGGFTSIGLSFNNAVNGYIVPKMGFTFNWLFPYYTELTKYSRGVYGGVGVRYPNKSRLRLEVSATAHLWFGETYFGPMLFRAGAYYFFGKR